MDSIYTVRVDGARRYCVLTEPELVRSNGLNRLEVFRDSVKMENVVVVFENGEQDIELAFSTNNTDIPDLKSIV